MNLIGKFVILLISALTSDWRSTTCVAPSDLRSSVLCVDAVVMMGEKPESFANWTAKQVVIGRESHKLFNR